MKTKFLALLVTGAAFATPANANSPDNAKLNFSCQMSDGVPTTVAQFADNEAQLPVFYWQAEAVANKSDDTPQELCNVVAEKLADYSAQGYDLSNINFVGTEQGGLPVICANAGGTECSKILLTLNKAEQPDVVASDLVDSILNENLQSEKIEYRKRGVQSISYQVDFWSLLGLTPKNFGK